MGEGTAGKKGERRSKETENCSKRTKYEEPYRHQDHPKIIAQCLYFGIIAPPHLEPEKVFRFVMPWKGTRGAHGNVETGHLDPKLKLGWQSARSLGDILHHGRRHWVRLPDEVGLVDESDTWPEVAFDWSGKAGTSSKASFWTSALGARASGTTLYHALKFPCAVVSSAHSVCV